MSDLLSIIVPIYNVEKYLERCISSIVAQSYANTEIILVDDGSSDGSGAICDSWKKRDARIKVIHKINGGLADARNAGIDCASGEYIAFIDGDDSVEPEMYEVMIAEMEACDAKIACCGKRKKYVTGKEVLTQNCEKKMVFKVSDALGKLLEGSFIDESACDKVFKRSLFEGIRFPKGEINEDIPIMPHIFAQSENVVHVGKAFYNYHQNVGSITRSGYSVKMHVHIEHMQIVKEYIIQNYPELEESLMMLLGRYSCSLLYRLYAEPKGKKIFHSDYQWYRSTFRSVYHVYVQNESLSLKDKILAQGMYYGWGRLLSRLNKLRKAMKM